LIGASGNGLLVVNGGVTLGSGSMLNIDLLGGFDPSNGTSFTILDYGTFNGGTFSIIGPTFNGGTQQWVITSYNGGDGDDIVLTAEAAGTVAAPEPSSLFLLSAALAALAGSLWKKRAAATR
jgi:hypothetical protein